LDKSVEWAAGLGEGDEEALVVERRPVPVDRGDVEALWVMSQIHLAATGDRGDRRVVTVLDGDLDALADGVLASVRLARRSLDALDVVGSTRFALPKRVFVRVFRVVTYKLVVAARALSDALEATAVIQSNQLAHAQRMNDSLRALVVSADLAISDAVERLAGSDGVAQSPGVALESEVALLEARVAELEERLAKAGGEVTT